MTTGDLFAGTLPKPLHAAPASSATEAQIARLLGYLHRRPCHTHELRRFGISHPAGRVQDCRRAFKIDQLCALNFDQGR